MRKEPLGKMIKKEQPGILALALAFSLLVFATACSKNANSTNSGNSSNTSSSTKTSSSPTSTSTSSAGMSPTAVFKAYYDAAVKRDFDSAKKYLSSGTMRMMEEGAKKEGKTVDESMKESPGLSPSDIPQLSNEQINDDTATVDMSAQGQKMTMPFVKEDGEWKIAMDKFLENMMGGMKDKSSEGEGNGDEGHDKH